MWNESIQMLKWKKKKIYFNAVIYVNLKQHFYDLLIIDSVGFYYCDSCYKFIHDKKENMNHKKEKIDYYLPIQLRCNAHQNVPLNLFCLDEKGNIILFNIYYK